MGSADAGAGHRDLVRRGYDAISRVYRPDDDGPIPVDAGGAKPYDSWVGELRDRLTPGARVLDLGCGAGIPATRMLADAGFSVTGIDISAVQIERARVLVPHASFVRADMTRWESAPARFDAIVSFYALIHLPLEDQRPLIGRLARWLAPGGYLLAIVGHTEWTGIEEYLGAPMFWDHADAATYLSWFSDAGLDALWDRHIPEGSSGHTLALLRRPVTRPG
jgi:SAM-dependent methyltransferase